MRESSYDMTMSLNNRLGVCSWSLQAANPAELVEAVAACGLGSVQLVLNPITDDPDTWGNVGRRLADAGIIIHSGMFGCVGEDYSSLDAIRQTGGIVPDATWPQNQRIIEAALQAAQPLNLDIITTHAGFIPHDPESADFDKLVDRVRWVADLFRDAGITLLLETGQETADDLWTFLNAVDSHNVGVNFDPANMILYDKGDPIAALQRLMPRVQQVHIKDAVRTRQPGTWGSEVAVGDGEVDWPAFLRTLDEAAFTGNLIIEREAGDARLADIRQARTRLEAWAAEL